MQQNYEKILLFYLMAFSTETMLMIQFVSMNYSFVNIIVYYPTNI